MAAEKYRSPDLSLTVIDREFDRADIEFHGVDHSGASYEARVFLNNPDADEDTEMTLEHGYAGSYHIFGHGGCFGDIGHCEVRSRRPFDPRPAHHLSPARKVVIATEAVRWALEQGDTVSVTIVPVVMSATEKCDTENVVAFDNVMIVTYRS